MSDSIQLSYSAISTFLDCRRKFWWEFMRNLVPAGVNKAYLVGETVHHGIYQLYAKNENAVDDALQYFGDRVNDFRKSFTVSAEIEQELVEQEYIIRGILMAYKNRYEDIINVTEHLHNEFELTFNVTNDITIVSHLDNILKNGPERYVHEIKTTKSLTPEYVRNIQNSLQASMYFHGNNHAAKTEEEKFAGIIYDVIKKPSIRRKKTESYDGYLNRLIDYYDNPNDFDLFHMEIIKFPIITKARAFETIEGVGNDIIAIKDNKSKYYCNDKFCYVYSKCSYFDLCHFGENANNLMHFKERDTNSTKIQHNFGE